MGYNSSVRVTERPKAFLTVQPEPSQISGGESVTLKCDIQGEDWTYSFICGGIEHKPERKEFKITVDSMQTCKCLGWRRSGSSEWSDEVTLTVSGIKDKPKIRIKPQNSVFTGDTVTLSCDAGRTTEQRILYYKDSTIIGADNDTKTLTDVKISDGGNFKCAVIAANTASTQGPEVQLIVTERPKALLRVQPNGGVFKGQTVTFTCHIPDSDVTRWSYSWNKDDSVIQDRESQEYKISSVDETHAGLYGCRGRETGGSRHTHTSDQHTLTVSGESVHLQTTLNLTIHNHFQLSQE
ncbi:CD166 antigen-like [Danio aesculapii]|uniref:CD166 antigen-like n=1 Tax=Danio aesculapii TaxID=1142201 RepID=UPI0024C014A7|nr:CD166 antigen-like [Danio aesculapii]